jgi:putative ABC transport system ATP-binding protein
MSAEGFGEPQRGAPSNQAEGFGEPRGGAPSNQVVVEGTGLRKSYRRGPEEVRALRQADLTLHAGELVVLVGPSGSGKTTLLNLLCGWEQPDEGRLAWPSAPTAGRVAPPWDEVAVVPQDLGLVDELSVAENVELPLWLAGRLTDGRAEAAALLERLGLARRGDRLPTEVSLGERQRVALARAMVVRPRLLLADEPTGHQDADWATATLDALRALATRGSCCLVATHSQELLAGADRVLAISDGRLPAGS